MPALMTDGRRTACRHKCSMRSSQLASIDIKLLLSTTEAAWCEGESVSHSPGRCAVISWAGDQLGKSQSIISRKPSLPLPEECFPAAGTHTKPSTRATCSSEVVSIASAQATKKMVLRPR